MNDAMPRFHECYGEKIMANKKIKYSIHISIAEEVGLGFNKNEQAKLLVQGASLAI